MGTFSRENNSTNKLNPWYITGFCEGEATFTFSRTPNGMALYFAIKLTAKDESVLKNVRNFFGGIGNIYKVKPIAPKGRGGYTKSARYFRTTSVGDLEVVVDHFEKYPLRGIKQQQFLIWKQMVKIKENFRRGNRKRLEDLAQQLSALASRNQPWE